MLLHINKKIEEICQKGNHYDGDGLKLRVDKNLNKNWIVRYQIDGKTREIGLGKYPFISLKDARQKLFNIKKMIYDGTDPLELKKENKLQKQKKKITFQEMCEEFINTFQVEWTNKKQKHAHTKKIRQGMMRGSKPGPNAPRLLRRFSLLMSNTYDIEMYWLDVRLCCQFVIRLACLNRS